MEKNLYKFIVTYSFRQQVVLTALSLISFVPYYYYLTMPKIIVNQGISGRNVTFPQDLAGTGISLDQTAYLFLLTGIFLLLVAVQQGFKYAINVLQGVSGERMLRRLRYELYSRVLRFPLPAFRRLSAGEIIPMITAEVEPLGGFIAEAYSLPIFQGGLLLVTFGFLLIQNPVMALAAVALYPLQFYVIPKLQRRVNQLGKERVRTQRKLGDRIGESIAGITEMHTHDTSAHFRADFARRLGRIYWIRYEIYQRKFTIKFINNFLQHLGPFFFYSIGGYLAIKGELDVGTVVAAVNAHKEMASPWKDLLAYYQQREDARIKYEQVIAQFEPAGLRDSAYQADEPESPVSLVGPLQANKLVITDENGINVVDNVSFSLPLPGRIAVVGDTGREELLQVFAGLLAPSKGRATINGIDLARVPQSVTGRRLAYVGPNGYVFNTSIIDNLLFSLRHRPLKAPSYSGDTGRRRQREVHEAAASGNTLDDLDADWTDYAAANATDEAGLHAAALRVLSMVGLQDDLYQLGLRCTIDPSARTRLSIGVLEGRNALRGRLGQADAAELVESWDRERYNTNATVAENLMFGTPIGDQLDPDRLAQVPFVLETLDKVGLRQRFVTFGIEVAKTMVELFADLPPDHEFFQQFSFISSDDLPEFKAILTRVGSGGTEGVTEEDRQALMSLPFKLIPARHRLGLIDDEVQAAIVRARAIFAAELPDGLRPTVAFFDAGAFNAAANILDNILFGKVAYGQAQATEKVGMLIGEVVDTLGLRDAILNVGLDFEAGIGGSRLTQAQRQKLAIARAIIKRPDILFLDEATAALDGVTQYAIMDNLQREFAGRGLVWSLHRAALAERFDRVLIMREGRLAAQGTYAELSRPGARFHKLLTES